jgi:hypothetical protein
MLPPKLPPRQMDANIRRCWSSTALLTGYVRRRGEYIDPGLLQVIVLVYVFQSFMMVLIEAATLSGMGNGGEALSNP